MKKKRLAAVAVAFVIIFSCGFTAFALAPLGIGDLIDILSNIDTTKYTAYSEQEWYTLSPSERAEQINFVINDQKGHSKITSDSDFINDSALSYKYYSSLIDTSPVGVGSGGLGNLMAKQYLEKNGLADFGLGYDGLSTGGSGGHFGGKFGDGTVADTLNDEFIDYLQKNPYSGNDCYVYLSNGNYCKITYLVKGSWDPWYVYLDESYSLEWSWLEIDLYSSDGYLLNTEYNDASGTCLLRGYNIYLYAPVGQSPFFDFEICDKSKGSYTFKRYGSQLEPMQCPIYYSNLLVDCVSFTDPNSIPVTGTDDNGNTIDLYINSDGVTYEGNTYNYNNDNSVTIDGDTYYISVDPSTVDNNYYNQFLENVFNNYNNYFTTSSTPFDGTDILSSLRSIFSSLESFRLSSYAQLKQIYTSVHDGFNSLRSSASNILKKLNTIISQLKSINKNFDELTEEQKKENELGWLDLIKKFQNKIGWSNLNESMSNISVAFFGRRQFETSEGGVVSVSIESNNTVIASSMPSLSIEFMGVSYNLYSCVGFLGSGIETIKGFIRVFLWVGFIVSLFRSLPSIIGGVSSVQDHSNNVVVDRHTGEVKWGA